MRKLTAYLWLTLVVLLFSAGKGFALPPCPGDEVENWHNCFGTFNHSLSSDWAGDKYVGEFRDGGFHGQGTYTYADGGKYVGEFRNNAVNGQGTFTLADGSKYVGESKNWVFHGQGSYTFGPSSQGPGDKYVGEFRDGEYNGQGTYTHGPSSDWAGDKYVGEWRDGQYNGQGTYTYGPSTEWAGDKYVGEFRNNAVNGQGTYTYARGEKYVGEFKNWEFHGQGTYTFTDGRVQEGVWEKNEFQYARKDSPPVTKSDPDEVVSASSGSGFSVSSDGHVITNHHVIDGCQKILIHHRGKSIPATILTYDPVNDLALLQGDFRPSTVFALSKDKPELLQDIYVAGYPFGQEISTSVKVTKGIISSLTGIRNNFSNIQIDAALQPGNSGGPIIDANGNIVGVAVAKLDFKKALETWGVIPENTNFGIKATVVRNLLESNDVILPNPNTKPISKSELGKKITDGTYYLSCWMTYAQIEMLRSSKVIFQTLD